MADVVVLAKVNVATDEQVAEAEAGARALNSRATVVRAASPVVLEFAERVRGRRVLVVDDGPTLTHGGMAFGAGYSAAVAAGALIVDPLPYADGEIRETLLRFPHVKSVLPALGYGPEQLAALERSIAAAPVDFIVSGTPIDLGALVHVPQPILRARYEFADAGEPSLGEVVDAKLRDLGLMAR